MRKKLAVSFLVAVLSGGTLLAPAMAGDKNKNKNKNNNDSTAQSKNTNRTESDSKSNSRSEACAALVGCGDAPLLDLSPLL